MHNFNTENVWRKMSSVGKQDLFFEENGPAH